MQEVRGIGLPEFRLARIIDDRMVLQQEKPITIWGWAKPGAEVAVTLTQDAEAGAAAVAEAVEQGTREAPRSQETDERTVTMRYVDNHGATTETYPANPNGSPEGITGLTSADGPADTGPARSTARLGVGT